MSVIPSDFFLLIPPRDNENPSSHQYFCDVRKFKEATTPAEDDIPSLSKNTYSLDDSVSVCMLVGTVFRNKSGLHAVALKVSRKEMFMLSNGTQMKLKYNRASCPFAICCSNFQKGTISSSCQQDERKGSAKAWTNTLLRVPSLCYCISQLHTQSSMQQNEFHQSAQASGIHCRSLKKETLWLRIAMLKNNPSLDASVILSIINIGSPQCKVWNYNYM